MFKNCLSLFLAGLAVCLVQDLSAARNFNRDPDVYRRYENRGDLDYRNNWMTDKNDYLRGESPFTPYAPPGSRQQYYQYRGQVYRSDLYDRPYHRGDWNDQNNWRYDKNAYLRGTVDQSDYYRAAYGQGAVNNYYPPTGQYNNTTQYNTTQYPYNTNQYPYNTNQYQYIPGTDSVYFHRSNQR